MLQKEIERGQSKPWNGICYHQQNKIFHAYPYNQDQSCLPFTYFNNSCTCISFTFTGFDIKLLRFVSNILQKYQRIQDKQNKIASKTKDDDNKDLHNNKVLSHDHPCKKNRITLIKSHINRVNKTKHHKIYIYIINIKTIKGYIRLIIHPTQYINHN